MEHSIQPYCLSKLHATWSRWGQIGKIFEIAGNGFEKGAVMYSVTDKEDKFGH